MKYMKCIGQYQTKIECSADIYAVVANIVKQELIVLTLLMYFKKKSWDYVLLMCKEPNFAI